MTKKYYGLLTLQGSRAKVAMDCMEKAGLLPEGAAATLAKEQPAVAITPDGAVSVENRFSSETMLPDSFAPGLPSRFGVQVAGFGEDGSVKAPEIFVSKGSPAGIKIFDKARACVFKSIGITPD